MSFEDGEDMANDDEEITITGEEFGIDDNGEFGHSNLHTLTPTKLKSLEFANLEVAYELYNEYARLNGFSIRKNKNGRNTRADIVWYSFCCNREGFRESKYLNMPNRQRDHRAMTRCGCEAQMRVRFDVGTGRWYVAYLNDDHNHQLVGQKFTQLLRSHRKMDVGDIAQMKAMRESGISIPKIYGSFATESGGYDKVNFVKRDIYNQVVKERKLLGGDAKGALKYLRGLAMTGPMMLWRYKVDSNGLLSHLFWCDGASQVDYVVFGDVLAFDATYKMNKYNCPLVVFSGVNHHNQTCVFGSGIVSNETEETYVWLLQQFLGAMKGKAPKSVITDGDYAMRNAIRIVFPQAHHRLCAWHLLRNATANVSQPRFTQLFERCMMGDYEVDEFEEKWRAMVEECDVIDHPWVQDLYERKMMWATAHIRGKFFAGFRTTSRCEALHAQLGKFVQNRSHLTEFLQHFQRCLEYLRNNEVQADFKSYYGDPVMQTQLTSLERSGSLVYTRALFQLFRSVLLKSATVKVICYKETATATIFVVAKYCRPTLTWHVSYYPQSVEFRCSCLRMESFGIPCVHIIVVMIYMDMDELPRSLVLNRWSKAAKLTVIGSSSEGNLSLEQSLYMTRYGALLHSCRRMCNLACRSDEDFNHIRNKIATETSHLGRKHGQSIRTSVEGAENLEEFVRDPAVVRSKGCGPSSSSIRRTNRRATHCGHCRSEGHNRTSCPHRHVDLNMDYGPLGSVTMANEGNGTTNHASDEMEYEDEVGGGSIDISSQ